MSNFEGLRRLLKFSNFCDPNVKVYGLHFPTSGENLFVEESGMGKINRRTVIWVNSQRHIVLHTRVHEEYPLSSPFGQYEHKVLVTISPSKRHVHF